MDGKIAGNIFIVFMIMLVIGISGCIGQGPSESNATTYVKDGIEYTFSNNIYEATKVPVYGHEQIYSMLSFASNIVIVYNGSIPEENSQLAVTAYNIVSKLQTYYLYSQNRFANFTAVDINDKNATLEGNSVLIYLYTNKTGANETSISVEPANIVVLNGTTISYNRVDSIVLRGTNYRNLTLVADRLILLILGFESDANFGPKECVSDASNLVCIEGNCSNAGDDVWVKNITCVDIRCRKTVSVEFRSCEPMLTSS